MNAASPDPGAATPAASARYVVVDGVLTEPAGDRTLLIAADSSELMTLNAVGSVVWGALVDGAGTADALVDAVLEVASDVDRDVVDRDVRGFLAELLAAGLLIEA